MKKKEIKIEAIVPGAPTIIVEDVKVESKKVIGKLDLNFNQEDINKLRDKVNEIVDFLNN